MKKISGIITNKSGEVLENVFVALKDSRFEDVLSTTTNENGEYLLEAEEGYYPFLIAVREYAENFLEYWCQNIYLIGDIEINAKIDKLEIYGLNCFVIKGAYPALTIYFRPMSLSRICKKEKDIAPILSSEMVNASVNGIPSKIYLLNKVREFCGDCNMTAYLMQISHPSELREKEKNLLHIHVMDESGNIGEASLYF
ncbi:carboxypeptidase-like regulatory domain-containing protein [Clostridium sp. JN-9]|uniref:carboxypeptidase-like regulatory domain-containing protein n=1 Tax=Clostridium sp. JN-9 TaxID=2507159 RepID=UPI000FFE1A98|nr:carboxypeptidase-like regulatory domain-containing protein [Clostridium sp. JN-9]QAT39628.1 carboxypeptidase regulatory-like domain-containing protein [Clostridium sp. JN-9]